MSLTIDFTTMTDLQLTPQSDRNLTDQLFARVADHADYTTAQETILEYIGDKAANTIRTHSDSVKRFAEYLNTISDVVYEKFGIDPDKAKSMGAELEKFSEDMILCRKHGTPIPDINAWRHISYGLIAQFKKWMLTQGDAIGTINARLSALKVIAGVAFQSGVWLDDNGEKDPTRIALINTVKGFSRKGAKNANERRDVTRRGLKKAEHTEISDKQAAALKALANDDPDDDTPQDRRNRLMMCLLIDHGLRAGEVCGLKVGDFNLTEKKMTFYREKVDKTQTHDLSHDTYHALLDCERHGEIFLTPESPLLRGSIKGGKLTDGGISTRSLTKMVKKLGANLPGTLRLDRLSAHDCRHYWATYWAKQGIDPFRLQEAGGWSSLAMPRRYIDDAKIANEGMTKGV